MSLVVPVAIVGVLAVISSRKKPLPLVPGTPPVGGAFGEAPFVAPATPEAPVQVTGCSYVASRRGTRVEYFDANTGAKISESEAVARSLREKCVLP
jgi:hypothetical protein